ncbi:MAG: type II secretion system F family protein [Planctomycetia bacterium]
MPQFRYIAVTHDGLKVPGTLLAASRSDALQALAGQMLMPVSLSEQSTGSAQRERVSPAAMSVAYSLLSDQLETGVPLLRALQVMAEQSSDQTLRATLSTIATQVADGTSLATAMTSRPSVFSALDVSMVQAGEEGGFLEESLRRLAAVRERQEEIRGRIRSAAAYPLLLAIVASLVVTGMLIFFVPKFQPLFDSLQQSGRLPWPTRALLGISDFLKSWGLLFPPVLFAAIFFIKVRIPEKKLARHIDQLLMRIRGIGPVVRSVAIARFCRVLGSLLQNGVPMLRSLEIARHATGNQVLSETIAVAAESISSGKNLAGPLAASGHFPVDVLEMIAVAEQANRLDSVLLKLADKLESRAQQRLDILLRLLEPIMMLIMAVIVGFMVVALLMPVFEGTGLG